jgi:hypothetical protein
MVRYGLHPTMLLERTKHVTETLRFLLKFFSKGRVAALQGTRRGKRFPCSFSSLLLSFALTASLATPTQRRRFPSRRLARAYFVACSRTVATHSMFFFFVFYSYKFTLFKTRNIHSDIHLVSNKRMIMECSPKWL